MKTCNICHVSKEMSEFYRYTRGNDGRRCECMDCTNATRVRYDWKSTGTGWQYSGDVDDQKYMKDRTEFFNEGGNGWWILKPYKPAYGSNINN